MAIATESAQIVPKFSRVGGGTAAASGRTCRDERPFRSGGGGTRELIGRHHGHTRLNFREAERRMPKENGGKSASFAEFSFKIESYMTAWDSTGWR